MNSNASAPAGKEAGTRCFRAPGRVNIIGEHTDYSDGFVLPIGFSAYTTVSATLRKDRRVEFHSHAFDETVAFELDDLGSRPATKFPAWGNYVFGVAAELANAGVALRGARLEIESDLPVGAGLSSSAALEVTTALAMLELAGATMSKTEIATLCRRAESRYAGVNCGIMDQYTVTICPPGHAMLLDCRSLETEFLPVPGEIEMLIMHSGVRHELADSGYNERAAECARATRILAQEDAEVLALRDADLAVLDACKTELDDALFRRARHVITENARTLAAAEALRQGNFKMLGNLVRQSHESLRDDFEVSCAEIDRLVDTALGTDGILGARMIGGGFGGSVLALAEAGVALQALDMINAACSRHGHPLPWSAVAKPAEPLVEIPAS